MLIILLYLGAAFRGDRRQHDPTLFEKLKAREIQASLRRDKYAVDSATNN